MYRLRSRFFGTKWEPLTTALLYSRKLNPYSARFLLQGYVNGHNQFRYLPLFGGVQTRFIQQDNKP